MDVLRDSLDNVLHASTKFRIFNLVSQGKVLFVWIGMPCTTFSIARKAGDGGPPPVRSDLEPMGISGLRGRNLQKVLEGNQLLFFSLELIRLCNRHRVPWALENPHSSRCWITDPMKPILHASRYVVLDFCQYGEAWRKRTGIMYQGIDLSSLEKCCQGHNGNCSRTNRKHLRLTGTNTSGNFWTLVAQPYPLLLVQAVARLLKQQLG